MLTKKHFIELANALYELKDNNRVAGVNPNFVSVPVQQVEEMLIRFCRSSNPSFDDTRFRLAAHVEV